MRTMTAAFFLGDRRIEIREVPVPQPAPGEVLLKVLACGVCGTDYHIYQGELADAVAGFHDRRDRQVKVAVDPWA